jgi:uncharacterized membrane protein
MAAGPAFEANVKHYIVWTRLSVFGLLMAGAISGLLWAIIVVVEGRSDFAPLIFMAALFVFVMGTGFSANYRLAFKTPAIRIDDDGIMVRHWSDVPVPWSNIARAWETNMAMTRFASLTLIDPARNPAQSAFLRFGRWMRRKVPFANVYGIGDLTITTEGTNGHFDAMMAVISARMGGIDVPERI